MITMEQHQEENVGFLLVDKPNGMTSSTCVQTIRTIVGRKARIGHAGTLDLFATGLLVIGVGRAATKHLSEIMELDKTYQARAKLGQLTDTLDIMGRVMVEEEASVTFDQVQEAIDSFGSGYLQTPPVYSALKFQGKALSKLARKETMTPEYLEAIVQEKSKHVSLYSCTLKSVQLPFFTLTASVSHGTYMRSFMNDIACKLKTYATTHELRRLTIGPFLVDNAATLAQLSTKRSIEAQLISLDTMNQILASYVKP